MVTYQQLQLEARAFLVNCADLTLTEHYEQGLRPGITSPNEILGMGTRLLAEQALNIQTLADQEERGGL